MNIKLSDMGFFSKFHEGVLRFLAKFWFVFWFFHLKTKVSFAVYGYLFTCHVANTVKYSDL